jgi:PAS domain S-box-containing protein
MNHIPNDTAVAPASRPAAGELHQTIFEQASDCLFVADTTGRCIEVNRAGCALLGAAREELLGRLIDDILCNAGCPPDVLDAIPRQAGQFHLAERDLARRDGGVLAAEIKLQRLADGALLASVRDLSVRKQTDEYERGAPAGLREIGAQTHDGVISRLVTYRTHAGERRVAELIGPAAGPAQAAILFVHWYEPEAHDSNRTQFQGEAAEMARRGTLSLLVETMWSDRDWFLKRTQADDYANSIRQVVELRQALDLLLAESGAATRRLAYVGHDFGAMYGVLMGKVDRRPACYALMAGTPRFPDWYLYYPRLAGAEREQFIASMAPLDPIAHVGALAPAPLLFQFGRSDPHVPAERAQAVFDAARESKQLAWYDCGHALDAAATQDRIAWLTQQLGLADS